MKKIILIIALIMTIFQLVVMAIVIDIGSPAINRGASQSAYSQFNIDNPANATGTITSVEIWAVKNLSNVKVATFYLVSGEYYSTRDYESIGSVTAGSKQTFSVNLDVQIGDYLGIYYSSGRLEKDGSGYSGIRYKAGDYIPCTHTFYSIYDSDATLSLYGIGATAEAGNAIMFGTNF